MRTLEERLRYATATFGDLQIDRLTVTEIGSWRKRLPEGSAWGITKALRQVLHYAVRAKLLDENLACQVPNPEPKRREVQVFASVGERSEEHTSELQSPDHLVCRLLLEKTKQKVNNTLSIRKETHKKKSLKTYKHA